MTPTQQFIQFTNENLHLVDRPYILLNFTNKLGNINGRLTKMLDLSTEEFFARYLEIERPKCKCCDEWATFDNYNKIFGTYCSNKCATSDKDLINKRNATIKETYGVDNISQLQSIKDKKAETMMSNYGVRTPLEVRQIQIKSQLARHNITEFGENQTDYEIYRTLVDKLTAKNDLSVLPNYDKRAANGYHLDHKYSIKDAFDNRIPAYIVANINNLEMLWCTDNTSKGSKSSITLDELYNS